MSFARTLEYASPPERANEPRLEDRLALVELKFVQRIVQAMPLPVLPPQARAAERIAEALVAKAFKDWFAPQRSAFIEAWTTDGRLIDASVEQSYGMFLEKIALRKGKHVATDHDAWGAAQDHLDQVLDAGAELFRCVMLQQEGWITQYRQLAEGNGIRGGRRQDYLRLANVARGFLGVRQATAHEREELRYAGLDSVGGAIIPEEARSRFVRGYRVEDLTSSFEIGRSYRQAYEEEVRRCIAEQEERSVLRELVREVLRSVGHDALIGPHIADNVRRYAQFCLRLEEAVRAAQLARQEATTVEARRQADARLEEVQRQRSGAKESLTKARILLRIYDEAKRRSLLRPDEEDRALRLTDLAKRLES